MRHKVEVELTAVETEDVINAYGSVEAFVKSCVDAAMEAGNYGATQAEKKAYGNPPVTKRTIHSDISEDR